MLLCVYHLVEVVMKLGLISQLILVGLYTSILITKFFICQSKGYILLFLSIIIPKLDVVKAKCMRTVKPDLLCCAAHQYCKAVQSITQDNMKWFAGPWLLCSLLLSCKIYKLHQNELKLADQKIEPGSSSIASKSWQDLKYVSRMV